MFKGIDLWDKKYTSDMVSLRIGTHSFDTYPDLPVNLYEALCISAKTYPDKTALSDDNGVTCTFSELQKKTDAFTAYLSVCHNIKKGEQAAILLYNSIEFAVSFLSLCKLGAVAVLLPTKFKKNELLALLHKTEARLLICDPDFKDWFDCPLVLSDSRSLSYGLSKYKTSEDAIHFSSPSVTDDAIIMFTSGTTSESKGVLLKNYNLMHAVKTYQRLLNVTSADCSVIPVPMYHITGLIALFGLFIYAGGTLYLHKFFDAGRVLKTVYEEKITFLHASPTVFSLLLKKKEEFPSLPSLKLLACGSANIPPERLKQIHSWLEHVSFRTVYGLTETSSPATIFPADAGTDPNAGSSGLPIPGSEFKIIGEDGSEVPPYTVGEILLRGTMVLSEYYHSQTVQPDEQGWLRTGDLGYFNTDGFLFVSDRKKDMINRGGEKIWCTDIENELYTLPGIMDAAIVGIPDDIYGEIPAAAVTLSDGCTLTETQIQEYLRPRIAKYKIPAKILILDEIPVTKNLKTDKSRIRELFYTPQKEEKE